MGPFDPYTSDLHNFLQGFKPDDTQMFRTLDDYVASGGNGTGTSILYRWYCTHSNPLAGRSTESAISVRWMVEPLGTPVVTLHPCCGMERVHAYRPLDKIGAAGIEPIFTRMMMIDRLRHPGRNR